MSRLDVFISRFIQVIINFSADFPESGYRLHSDAVAPVFCVRTNNCRATLEVGATFVGHTCYLYISDAKALFKQVTLTCKRPGF